MDTWSVLKKELNYFGIRLIGSKKCQLYEDDKLVSKGIVLAIRQLKRDVAQQKKTLLILWKDVVKLLSTEVVIDNFLSDQKMVDLFIFSLKDMSKYLMCFEETEDSVFSQIVDSSLDKDIKSFSKEQINKLPDYKISIDWTHRLINRLLYVIKLLAFAGMGEEKVSKYPIQIITIKTARGISGPWANLDLPMGERAWTWDDYLDVRSKDKKMQRRYRKGFENYNNSGGAVSEGHYWRELRNEPFSWYDRSSEDPYPHRSLLNY